MRVRLVDLLSHTSELAPQVDGDGWKAASLEGVVHAMLARKPGPRTYSYSNVGNMTVGVMLERSAKATWEEIMQKRLFDPLGMKSCGFGAPAAPARWTNYGPIGANTSQSHPVPILTILPPWAPQAPFTSL
ncbi:MAG: beta-lactamase family protein [Clostridia bacterium]|nr:beta-lactamase family protein [Deltaproteobacteria bacterium]